jgi:hypothetical protein
VRIPYWRLLTCGTMLGTIACGFAAYSSLSLLLVWFAPYLDVGLGFGPQQGGWLMALPPIGLASVTAVTAWLSQRAVMGGMSTRRARGLPCSLGAVGGGIAICLIPFCAASELKIALMVLGVALPSAIYILGYPMLSEFAPAGQRGAVLSIANAVITMAGVIVPFGVGRVIGPSLSSMAGYEKGFLYCGIITLIGGLIGLMTLQPDTQLARLMASSEGNRAQQMEY